VKSENLNTEFEHLLTSCIIRPVTTLGSQISRNTETSDPGNRIVIVVGQR